MFKKVFGPFAFMLLFVLKFGKFLLPLLKLGKFTTLISMLASVGVYAMAFGWPFAAGFVALIFVHECGHALALRREGIPSGLPVFIPFLGAFIAMKGLPRNAYIEAKVGIAGPLLGSLGALSVLLMGLFSENHQGLFLALAQTGFLINLFNMIPVSPMDGGRVAGGISRWLLIVGLLLGVWIFWQLGSPLLLLMLILGGLQTWRSFKRPRPGLL